MLISQVETGTFLVYYPDERDGEDAYRGLQGRQEFILTRLTTEPEQKGRTRFNAQPGGTILVSDLNVGDYQEIVNYFSRYGTMIGVRFALQITFADERDAEDAIRDANGYEFNGARIKVAFQ